MAVFNGAAFLQAQLDTVAAQTLRHIDVWASNDGSTDGSDLVLLRAASGWAKGRFEIAEGPRAGFAENFRSLLSNASVDADYVAFCDQDDLWDADKLAVATEWLSTQAGPALYCSRTRTIAVDGRDTGMSPLFAKPPSFRNAIVQSIAGANTMVMNRQAFDIVREASRRSSFVSHDWWCYLIVSGCGGTVHYDPAPRLGYRQHPGNLVGENNSWRARMSRLAHLMRGRFVGWNEHNLAGLRACEDLLSAETRETLGLFARVRTAPLRSRVLALWRSGLYRQTRLGQCGLYWACVFRKL
jgi:glycosyltransferase involved in cell wall biosynthesis